MKLHSPWSWDSLLCTKRIKWTHNGEVTSVSKLVSSPKLRYIIKAGKGVLEIVRTKEIDASLSLSIDVQYNLDTTDLYLADFVNNGQYTLDPRLSDYWAVHNCILNMYWYAMYIHRSPVAIALFYCASGYASLPWWSIQKAAMYPVYCLFWFNTF